MASVGCFSLIQLVTAFSCHTCNPSVRSPSSAVINVQSHEYGDDPHCDAHSPVDNISTRYTRCSCWSCSFTMSATSSRPLSQMTSLFKVGSLPATINSTTGRVHSSLTLNSQERVSISLPAG